MENVADVGKDDDQMELPPGFRFHPTDEELISHYLLKKVMDVNFSAKAIGEADLNKSEPWELPTMAKMGENQWYFFCMKDMKYPTGTRTNRATKAGYWKATGKDKKIRRERSLIGMKKTLVFYRGRAPNGEKTNWVMHEYRLDSKLSHHILPNTAEKEWVIGRVFEKTSKGEKVNIPGLKRVGSFYDGGRHPPSPLTEPSPRTVETKPNLVQLADVPCFSIPMNTTSASASASASAQRNSEETDHRLLTNTNPLLSVPPNLQLQFPSSSVQLHQQSIHKMEMGIVTSMQETRCTGIPNQPGLPSILSSIKSGPRVMFHDLHQQTPSTSAAGPADFDSFMELLRWGYLG